MKTIKRVFFISIFALLVLSTSMPVQAASKLKLSKTKATVYIGTPITLKVTGATSSVKWESKDRSIATVSSKGKVTGRKEGNVKIIAKVDKKALSCNVTVKKPSINYQSKSLYVGKKTTLKLTGTKAKSFKSSNKSVATVSSSGVVTAKKVGTAKITVQGANKKTYNCKVTVLCKHSYTSKITKEPTCMEEGEKTYTCSKCQHSYKESIAKTEHKYIDNVIKPTCTEKGYTEHNCSVCGNNKRDTYVDALGHNLSDWIVTTPATENREGSEQRTCSRCYYKESRNITKLPHVHQYTDSVVSATCGDEGYTVHTCLKCGYEYRDSYISALGHDWSDWETTTPATEETTGLKTRECQRCSETDTEIIPMLMHTHNYEYTIVSPTCTEKGYTKHTCVCGDSYVDTYVNELGHDWGEWKIIKEPTEAETGKKKHICSRCEEEETEEIPVTTHEHQYASVVTKPTCTEQGYTTHTCTKCGDVYKDNYTNALGHVDNWITTKEATCIESGTQENKCSRCGKVLDTRPIKKTEHDYGTVVTEPTCTGNGYTTYTCSGCGDSYTSDYKDPIDHELSDWICEGECGSGYQGGTTYKECVHCKEHFYVSKINLYHQNAWVTKVESTCTEKGIEEYKCTKCGAVSETKEMDMKPHDFSEWTVIKEPSAEACNYVEDFGERQSICSVCDKTETQSIIRIDLGGGETKLIYGSYNDEEAYKTFAMVNELRTSLGLNELEWSSGAELKGKIRAAEISYIQSHDRPNGETKGYAENFYWSAGSLDAQTSFNGFYNSQGHYDNMVKESRKYYYCSLFDCDDGCTICVQLMY